MNEPFAVAVVHGTPGGSLSLTIADGRGLDTRGIASSCSTFNIADVLPWMEARHIVQLWIARDVAAALDRLQAGWRSNQLWQAKHNGWETDADELDSWAVFAHRGVYGLRHVVVQHEARPFGRILDGPRLAQALAAFAAALGVPFYRSPGATGTQLIRAFHPRTAMLDPVQHWPEPALDGALERDFVWYPRLDAFAASGAAYIRAYDRNAQYLAASGVCNLGTGEPYHATGPALREAITKRLPGYFRVAVHEQPLFELPNYFHPDGRGDAETLWITGPSLELGYQYGFIGDVSEAYVWPLRARVLEPWYKRLRGARTALMASDPVALSVLKQTYTQTIGWFALRAKIRAWQGGELSDLLRLNWRHDIIAMARANLYRKLVTMVAGGSSLLGVQVDCAYVLVGDREAPDAPGVELGPALGHWKRAQIPVAAVGAEVKAMQSDDPRVRRRAFAAIRAAFGDARDRGL